MRIENTNQIPENLTLIIVCQVESVFCDSTVYSEHGALNCESLQ